jgi:hypothetical protein
MPLLGTGALAIWNGIAGEAAEEFYRWHNGEHMPERVGVPGFLRGRRYLSPSVPHDYFTLYETETAETIGSAPYLARLNDPTPWTRRMLPHFRSTVRVGCRVATSHGRGQGGGLLTLRVFPRARRWDEPDLATVLEVAGVIGVHLLEPVPETTRIQTKEKELRGARPGDAEAPEPWVLLVEMNDAELGPRLLRGPLAGIGSRPDTVSGAYRLQFSLDRGPGGPG